MNAQRNFRDEKGLYTIDSWDSQFQQEFDDIKAKYKYELARNQTEFEVDSPRAPIKKKQKSPPINPTTKMQAAQDRRSPTNLLRLEEDQSVPNYGDLGVLNVSKIGFVTRNGLKVSYLEDFTQKFVSNQEPVLQQNKQTLNPNTINMMKGATKTIKPTLNQNRSNTVEIPDIPNSPTINVKNKFNTILKNNENNAFDSLQKRHPVKQKGKALRDLIESQETYEHFQMNYNINPHIQLPVLFQRLTPMSAFRASPPLSALQHSRGGGMRDQKGLSPRNQENLMQTSGLFYRNHDTTSAAIQDQLNFSSLALGEEEMDQDRFTNNAIIDERSKINTTNNTDSNINNNNNTNTEQRHLTIHPFLSDVLQNQKNGRGTLQRICSPIGGNSNSKRNYSPLNQTQMIEFAKPSQKLQFDYQFKFN